MRSSLLPLTQHMKGFMQGQNMVRICVCKRAAEGPPKGRILAALEQPASTELLLYARPGLRHWVHRLTESPQSPWVAGTVPSSAVQVRSQRLAEFKDRLDRGSARPPTQPL